MKYEKVCKVNEYGVIYPSFRLNESDVSSLTSGQLKYFFPLAGKTVKITIEIMEDSNEHRVYNV